MSSPKHVESARGWSLQHGDCRALMAGMEGCSVDSVVTDPPYELGFMGRRWDSTGVAYDIATWVEVLRVLKPGGWLAAFGGARTYHRMVCAIEDAGFEIRDQVMWIYGSGFPKGGNRDGKGTCLKPAHEPIVLARKRLIGRVARNEAAFGTGALNIDSCRIASAPDVNDRKAKAGALLSGYNGGWSEQPGRPFSAAAGRWPANVVHDGSDEVVARFPKSAANMPGPNAGRAAKRNLYLAGQNADHAAFAYGDSGSAARFFYCAKATKADRDEGLGAFAPQAFIQYATANGESGKPSSLSQGRATEYRNTHPTVKPELLMRWLVRLVTPAGGLVLDPFTGSGSTGKAAMLEGRSFIGCELTAEYLPIARARIAAGFKRAAMEVAA